MDNIMKKVDEIIHYPSYSSEDRITIYENIKVYIYSRKTKGLSAGFCGGFTYSTGRRIHNEIDLIRVLPELTSFRPEKDVFGRFPCGSEDYWFERTDYDTRLEIVEECIKVCRHDKKLDNLIEE